MKTYTLALLGSAVLLGISALAATGFMEPGKDTPSVVLTLFPERMPDAGKPIRVVATLAKDGKPLEEDQLKVIHTHKFHLLVIDPTLTDYHHLHPEPTPTPGSYKFIFTPKLKGGYRAWANVTPMDTAEQEFAVADLGNPGAPAIAKKESDKAIVQGYRFGLSFDEAPAEGEEVMGSITVLDKNGKEVKTLEPVMGAFAHIVGFYEDYQTAVHTHPMGDAPKGDADRAGPTVMFHLTPEQAGFLRIFAQFRIDGQEIVVPFGINVAAISAD